MRAGLLEVAGRARGPHHLLRGELDAAAALVFALAPPGGLELGVGDSCGR